MTDFPSRLSRAQASAYLELQHGIRRKVGTLAKLAVIGGGPVFRKVGARSVAYDRADLDAWAETLVSAPRRNTAEAA